jgi:hypothetical protein
MSTVLETIQARSLGLRVAAFSCLTNWAAGITADTLDHHEVLETGKQAAQAMIHLLTNVVGAADSGRRGAWEADEKREAPPSGLAGAWRPEVSRSL